MPFNGPLRVEVDGVEHVIAVELAAGIYVSAVDPGGE
jgi:hypothetical protein